MGIDETDVSPLLGGKVPSDDPSWVEVSSFLDQVEAAYPTVPTTAFESRHLAAVARESRLVQSELQHHRQGVVQQLAKRTRRVLAGSVGAALIVVTAGVGVASALGINPLEQLLFNHPVAPSVAPQAPTPRTERTDDAADGARNGELGTVAPRTVPSSGPSATPGSDPTSTEQPSTQGHEQKSDQAEAKASKEAAKAAEKAAKEAAKAEAKAAKEAAKAGQKDLGTGDDSGKPKRGNGVGGKSVDGDG